ncbi:hypothetical protein Bca52824_004679 [Brassica carinata]|uniref:Uncharacterized protein n=1 Tax=Brassica carinata TaxID=52824 RepID=A0A8X7WPH8_BRACI|nr:hypothetical protein Bca52824_004679 [Brassica carinata]
MPLREANELAQVLRIVFEWTLWLARVYMEEYRNDDISLLLTLATWYKRLVKLDLSGCEGSLMGLKPLGNVVTTDLLRISSCRKVDPCTGPEKLMRSCPALECCLNDKEGM